MNKKVSFLLLCALFLALIGGAAALYHKLGDQLPEQSIATQTPTHEETDIPGDVTASEGESQPQPSTAPDFVVLDAAGNEVALSDFFGKPVVLNFWASWCGPCKSEMPDFETAYQTYGEDVHFLMVNLTDGSRETVDSASQFIAKQGYTFPVYFDVNYSAAIAYGTSAIPVTFFIDADGFPIAYAQGALSGQALQKGLDMIYPAQ